MIVVVGPSLCASSLCAAQQPALRRDECEVRLRQSGNRLDSIQMVLCIVRTAGKTRVITEVLQLPCFGPYFCHIRIHKRPGCCDTFQLSRRRRVPANLRLRRCPLSRSQPCTTRSSPLTQPSCSMRTAPRLRLWGLLLLATRSESFQRTRSSRAQTRLHASTTLPELLEALKPYAPVRCIVVLPGAGAILESAVDASRWTMSESTTPTGKTLLTCKIADGSSGPPPFELHLDVDRATKATLGVSPKTGGPIVRVMDGDGAGLVTLLPTGDSFVDDVVGKLGEEVDLVRR